MLSHGTAADPNHRLLRVGLPLTRGNPAPPESESGGSRLSCLRMKDGGDTGQKDAEGPFSSPNLGLGGPASD